MECFTGGRDLGRGLRLAARVLGKRVVDHAWPVIIVAFKHEQFEQRGCDASCAVVETDALRELFGVHSLPCERPRGRPVGVRFHRAQQYIAAACGELAPAWRPIDAVETQECMRHAGVTAAVAYGIPEAGRHMLGCAERFGSVGELIDHRCPANIVVEGPHQGGEAQCSCDAVAISQVEDGEFVISAQFVGDELASFLRHGYGVEEIGASACNFKITGIARDAEKMREQISRSGTPEGEIWPIEWGFDARTVEIDAAARAFRAPGAGIVRQRP